MNKLKVIGGATLVGGGLILAGAPLWIVLIASFVAGMVVEVKYNP